MFIEWVLDIYFCGLCEIVLVEKEQRIQWHKLTLFSLFDWWWQIWLVIGDGSSCLFSVQQNSKFLLDFHSVLLLFASAECARKGHSILLHKANRRWKELIWKRESEYENEMFLTRCFSFLDFSGSRRPNSVIHFGFMLLTLIGVCVWWKREHHLLCAEETELSLKMIEVCKESSKIEFKVVNFLLCFWRAME